MQLIRGLYNLKSRFNAGSVVTIGNYDGLHLGHQQILSFVKERAKGLNLPSVAVIFEPQPEEFFNGDNSSRLTSLREKIFLLEKNGIDNVLIIHFDTDFSNISALDFINRILIGSLNARHLVVGDDFVFGHKRDGGFDLLEQVATKEGIQVTKVPAFNIDGVRVSSSLIRSALSRGDLDMAAKFLGRPYQVSGKVIDGAHIGRNLGFPTANIYLKRRELPFMGVYLVKIHNLIPDPLFGLANIGFRPTFSGKEKRFEVYILDFDDNIYNKRVDIEFCKKIRDEQKFSSSDELKVQIEKDIVMAKEFIKENI